MATKHHFTAPEALKGVEERVKALALAVESGVATKYWLELLAYPPGSARSLWLFVGNAWRRLDNPNEGIQLSVQDAFAKRVQPLGGSGLVHGRGHRRLGRAHEITHEGSNMLPE